MASLLPPRKAKAAAPCRRPIRVRSGLATAPVLYAAEEFPELLPLIQRRFKTVRGARV